MNRQQCLESYKPNLSKPAMYIKLHKRANMQKLSMNFEQSSGDRNWSLSIACRKMSLN